MPVGPIVQGSGLGPTDFVIAISSLKPKYSENRLTKYADDISTCWSLLPALTALFLNLTIIYKWASIRNLKLNHAKTREMVVKRPRSKPIALPPLIPDTERVQEMVILGVTISDGNGFGTHMDKRCFKARKSMFGYVFWSPTATTVNVSLTLLGLLPSHGYFMPPLFVGDLPL